MLDQITPVILTFNEASNIGRTLERLRWARDIVVVDSFSDDETLEIASSFPQVRVYQRAFDGFANQWTFALNETGITPEWVLGIDADFLLTDEFVDELRCLQPSSSTDGFRARLRYCVAGRQLRFSLLPPLTVLYRRRSTEYVADAHTCHVTVPGQVAMLRASILHDDRKSLRHWLQSQQQYAELEARKLLNEDTEKLNLPDRIRKLRIVAPPAIFCYCLIRGGILDGWAGLFYAIQRALAELLLSLNLLEHDFRRKKIPRRELTQPESARGQAVAGGPADSSSLH